MIWVRIVIVIVIVSMIGNIECIYTYVSVSGVAAGSAHSGDAAVNISKS